MNQQQFNNLYLGNWEISEKDKLLYEIAEQYHKETEEYDRYICTGPIINDSILPRNNLEFVQINKYALEVKRRIYKMFPQFTKQEINKAIGNYYGYKRY